MNANVGAYFFKHLLCYFGTRIHACLLGTSRVKWCRVGWVHGAIGRRVVDLFRGALFVLLGELFQRPTLHKGLSKESLNIVSL